MQIAQRTRFALLAAALLAPPATAVHGGSPSEPAYAGVAVLQGRDGTCSAVLVSEASILTVVHCVNGAGEIELDWPDTGEPAQALDPRSCQPVAEQLLLCRLTWPVLNVHPLEPDLNARPFVRGEALTLIGSGMTLGGRHDGGLRRQASATVVDWTTVELKAGDEYGTSCFGDSGGALVRSGRVVAIATGSAGVPCLGAGTFARLDAVALPLSVLLGL